MKLVENSTHLDVVNFSFHVLWLIIFDFKLHRKRSPTYLGDLLRVGSEPYSDLVNENRTQSYYFLSVIIYLISNLCNTLVLFFSCFFCLNLTCQWPIRKPYLLWSLRTVYSVLIIIFVFCVVDINIIWMWCDPTNTTRFIVLRQLKNHNGKSVDVSKQLSNFNQDIHWHTLLNYHLKDIRGAHNHSYNPSNIFVGARLV